MFVETGIETKDLTASLPDPPFAVRDEAHLIELLREGKQSGLAVPMTESDWDDIRQEARTHVQSS